jgi:hypothetical protein
MNCIRVLSVGRAQRDREDRLLWFKINISFILNTLLSCLEESRRILLIPRFPGLGSDPDVVAIGES